MNVNRSRCVEWLRTKPARFLLLLGVSLLLMAVLSGAASVQYAITIEDQGTSTLVYVADPDPKQILAAGGIRVAPKDAVRLSPVEGLEATLSIYRAVDVRVYADGREISVVSAGETAGELLERLGIYLGDRDQVSVPLGELLTEDQEILVSRVEIRRIQREEAIPFDTVEIPTQTLASGKTRVLEDGAAGRKVCTVEQIVTDGEVTDERILEEEVLQEPHTRQLFVGNDTIPTSQLTPAEEIQLDANGNPLHYTAKVTGKATAYSALGKPTKLVPGCVAMDLSQYPRGTRLYIKTPDGSYLYGYSEVRDTGPAVNEGIILVDLFFGSYEESCLFGAKTVDIYILP